MKYKHLRGRPFWKVRNAVVWRYLMRQYDKVEGTFVDGAIKFDIWMGRGADYTYNLCESYLSLLGSLIYQMHSIRRTKFTVTMLMLSIILCSGYCATGVGLPGNANNSTEPLEKFQDYTPLNVTYLLDAFKERYHRESKYKYGLFPIKSASSAAVDDDDSGDENDTAAFMAEWNISIFGTMPNLEEDDNQVPRYSNRTPHAYEVMKEFIPGSFGVLGIFLGIIILATILGNVFVIVAILIEKSLQTVSNYLIVSLATADLMVACLVMPLGALYEVHHGWLLGPELCEIWTFSDVLCCTSSILHLVAIAMDRFWAVTDIEYVAKRTTRRILLMIGSVWSISLSVSIAPQFGFKDPDFLNRVNLHKRCLVSQNISYQIFATISTFYCPLMAILMLYWKIFKVARSRIRKQAFRGAEKATRQRQVRRRDCFRCCCAAKSNGPDRPEPSASIPLNEIPSVGSAVESSHHEQNTVVVIVAAAAAAGTAEPSSEEPTERPMGLFARHFQKIRSRRDKKLTLEARREKKAAQTLAIVTGAFVICWLPFFVLAPIVSICPDCPINNNVSSFFLWLGYFNSTLNPIIYTIFNPEFRKAFHRIIRILRSLSQKVFFCRYCDEETRTFQRN